MTMADYRAQNNLEGAYERFTTAYKTWKSRWWAVVEEIFDSCAEWAKKYNIDRIHRTLIKIVRKRGRPRKFILNEIMEFRCPAQGCGAYIVQHFDADGEPLWIKCGKADDVQIRLEQHFKSDYKGQAVSGVCLAFFPCADSDLALTVENVIRHHFSKKGLYKLGNDRFPDLTELTTADLAELTEKIQKISELW